MKNTTLCYIENNGNILIPHVVLASQSPRRKDLLEQIGIFAAKPFDELTTYELYEIMRARAKVFVGEEKKL